jgi:phosphoribosylaminoimidazolecarboxamide formyltransferase/IMP cyclohydrolase
MSRVVVKRALISVFDKTGVVSFAERLSAAGVEIVSSGGTAVALTVAGIPVTTVSEVTGSQEILGGRVKTLHPKLHGGILARPDNEQDLIDLSESGIVPIQLVVVSLYPFRETVAAPDATEAEIVEKIDVGGPAMIRAAAKNHAFVGVVTSADQYETVAKAVEAGGLDDHLRKALAAEAFFHTASYDAAIVGWIGDDLVVPLRRVSELRYGENPHQPASIFVEDGASPWWLSAIQLQGKGMSFNNYADAEAAWRLASDQPGCVAIVKHTNACGAAYGSVVSQTFERAWACDPVSAFGGVIAINGVLDEATAESIAGKFVEVVVCSGITGPAREILASRTNLRVLEATPPGDTDPDLRRVERGLLLQGRDSARGETWEVVSSRQPSEAETKDLAFAWTVAMHTKSNAIVVVNDGASVGVGAGDQSRVGAAERALVRAGGRSRGAVAASDAFFPFRDGLDVLAEAGVTAVVEPGGSRNDQELIDAANEHGLALVFSGRRHFKH